MNKKKAVIIAIVVIFLSFSAVVQVNANLNNNGLTVVTVNAAGAGGWNIGVGYETRMDRLSDLIVATGSQPDIISMTEFGGWLWCNPLSTVGDYDVADRLIWRLQNLTGVTYRIAYMVGREQTYSLTCHTYVGDMLLYNPERLMNVTQADAELYPQYPHDADLFDVHIRRSLPLCNRGTNLMPLDQLIDGPPQTDKCGRQTPSGPAWTLQMTGTLETGEPYNLITASLARFAYVHDPEFSFDVFTTHPHWDLSPADLITIEDFFNRWSNPPYRTTPRYYPPLVVGDFNKMIGNPNWPSGVLTVFALEGDVMAVRLGQSDMFPAVHQLEPLLKFRLPPGDTGTTCVNEQDLAFSDHCGLMVNFNFNNVIINRKVIYVDKSNWWCQFPNGEWACSSLGTGGPYPKVIDAVNAANYRDRLFIKTGSYNEQLTIDKAMELHAWDGLVTIGQ